jgi:hypothetical protein
MPKKHKASLFSPIVIGAGICLLFSGSQGQAVQPAVASFLSPEIKAQLILISRFLFDRQPEEKIIKAWEQFVEKRQMVDYSACIKFIFEEAKAEAEKRIRIAQERIQLYQKLKEAADAELEQIRKVKAEFTQRGLLRQIPRKKFMAAEGPPSRIVVNDIGVVKTLKELKKYEGEIIWTGQEASLQGTGGVALLEYAKDALQTAASNISGVGTLQTQMKKIVCRKLGSKD